MDYAQLFKMYGNAPDAFKGRYSTAECTGSERPLAARINTRRLALSLGILGAIVFPLFTGSFARFVKHPINPAVFDFQFSEAAIDCAVNPSDNQNCVKAAHDPAPHKIRSTSLDIDRTLPLARDFLLGLVVPMIFALAIPWLLRRYVRWITS